MTRFAFMIPSQEDVSEAKTTAETAKQKADEAMEAASAGGNPQIMTFARMQVATMDLTTYSDDSVSEINTLLPDFVPEGHEYKIGDSFLYEGKTYRVAQAHTSQAQWKPGATGTESLYYEIVIAPDGILVWHKPVGSHDAPGMGAKRHYPDADGPIYVSKREGNTSEPGTDEWWQIEGGETVEEPDEKPSNNPAEYDPEHQYAKGEQCTYNGVVYEWTLDTPGIWSPEAYPQGWKEIEAVTMSIDPYVDWEISEDALTSHTIAELKAYMEANGIDDAGCNVKADYIGRIIESQ